MRDDLRSALRAFRHRPTLALMVVATLALGIGANSAIFAAVDAILLKPLPYPGAEQLVSIYELNRAQRQATQLVAPVRLEEWNSANRTLQGIAGSYFENMTDTSGAIPERVEGMRTSPRFFAVLGVSAALGRTPTEDEERSGGPPSVVLSDRLWRNRFAADPQVVGRRLVLSGVSRTVVGVMPASFRYPTATTDAWIPAQMSQALMRERRARFYTAVGRLKPGITIEQAEADLTAVQTRLGEQFPGTDKGWGASIVALREEQVAGIRRSLWLLFAAVGLVLLAACGNVAGLMLAEAARRQHEVAVRFALGAPRWIIVRQLLMEGAVLAIAGGTAGLLLAMWGARLMRGAVDLPQMQDVHVDIRLILFTLSISVVTTLLFALTPALHATRSAPSDALARGGRGRVSGPQLLQQLLVGAQMALAIVLLVGAGLLVRSFVAMQQVSLGFNPDHVLTFRMSASWAERPDAVVSRHARTIARLREIPGVDAAALSQLLPAGLDIPPGEFRVIGRDATEKTFAHGRSVSAGYFQTLGIPMLRGTTCDDQPTPLQSKAVVTTSFAERFFPGSDPIGHELTTPGFPTGHVITIVGVAGDVRESGVRREPEPVVYWCGYAGYWPDPHFLVRTNPAHLIGVPEIRAALSEIEPKRAVYAVRPLTDTLSVSVSQQRASTILLSLFAAMALALSAVGLYGVMSQLVTARRREFGVRLALGARPAQVMSAVALQASWIAGAGIGAGLAAAFGLARVMTAMMFYVAPRDPITFATVPLVLAAVAAAAALVPVRRASRVDPMQALRDD